MLCCATLRYAMLCYAMLCYEVALLEEYVHETMWAGDKDRRHFLQVRNSRTMA